MSRRMTGVVDEDMQAERTAPTKTQKLKLSLCGYLRWWCFREVLTGDVVVKVWWSPNTRFVCLYLWE